MPTRAVAFSVTARVLHNKSATIHIIQTKQSHSTKTRFPDGCLSVRAASWQTHRTCYIH